MCSNYFLLFVPSKISSVGSIHFLPPSVVHGLLLLLQLSYPLTNGHTIRHWTRRGLTLARMDLQKRPNSFADIATPRRFDLALSSVFQQSLHLCTVGGWTLGGIACSSMLQQRHMELNTALTFLSLLFRQFRLLATCHGYRLERVRMFRDLRVVNAFLALVEIGTCWTVITITL